MARRLLLTSQIASLMVRVRELNMRVQHLKKLLSHANVRLNSKQSHPVTETS